jgi:hypothetical protein
MPYVQSPQSVFKPDDFYPMRRYPFAGLGADQVLTMPPETVKKLDACIKDCDAKYGAPSGHPDVFSISNCLAMCNASFPPTVNLPGGGTVTPNGNVFFAWAGYEGNGGAKGKVTLFVSKSTNGGVTWTTNTIDVSSSPPDCSSMLCGWAFLGAQLVMTSDSSGNIYLLWNAGSTAKGPERIYFAKSIDGGNTYSAKAEVSLAPAGTHHAFPAIAATGNGDVRISWMDARTANGGIDKWNVYYRSSTNGGNSWSNEVDLSTFVSGYSYISSNGFDFPFGDYYEIDIDEQGTSHLIFGEALNYDSPGSIWYVKGN